MLPHVFITDETEPAKSPPISSGIAHAAPTVISRPKTARHVYHTDATAFPVYVAGRIAAAASTNPLIATTRRAVFRLPVAIAQRSESHPPNRSPTVPASSGRLA